MRFDLLALYGGPDQVMTVTSGLASVLGLLLLFWNKVVGIFFKIVQNVPPRRYACLTGSLQGLSKRNSVVLRVRFLRKKVIVIGLDGLEPGIVEAMLERGELPNLAKIRSRWQLYPPANNLSGTNSGCVVVVYDRDQSRRSWNFRFHQPRSANLPARCCLDPVRAPEEHAGPTTRGKPAKRVPLWQPLSKAGSRARCCVVLARFLRKLCRAGCWRGSVFPTCVEARAKGLSIRRTAPPTAEENEQLVFLDSNAGSES